MAGDFGTVFMPEMIVSRFDDGWSSPEIVACEALNLHPGAHVFHYASTCFEGLKAFRQTDGAIALFRPEMNVARFAQSSALLALPDIDQAVVLKMIEDIVARFADDVPAAPASMYVRPTHIGTEPAIGKAAAPSDTSLLYVMLSPVGDYFASGEAALRVLLDTEGVRCGADHGMVKGGGNYASALKHIRRAAHEYRADQVLFCPEGFAQETGAANFVLMQGGELITKALDDSFLHGVTRDSILTLARTSGLKVVERELSVDELLERAAKPDAEAGLTGTAAVVAAIGTLIHDGKDHVVGSGKPGPVLRGLRETLNAIQWGDKPDAHNWVHRVS